MRLLRVRAENKIVRCSFLGVFAPFLLRQEVLYSSRYARHSGSAWKTLTFHRTSVGVKTAT